SGIENYGAGYISTTYGWAHHLFDGIFGAAGLSTFGEGGRMVVDGFTGATPLGLAAKSGWAGVQAVYSTDQIFWGGIPGSIGESSFPLILGGMLFLILTRVADYRIIVGGIIGFIVCSLLLNAIAPAAAELTPEVPGIFQFMAIPWYYQMIMGSFMFSIVFMATDPVSAASTPTGKWIYGFMIGLVGLIIRVLNPAYPEGWMLAILFMNVFAPLIDHYVLDANIRRRAKRGARLAAVRDEVITSRGNLEVYTPQNAETTSFNPPANVTNRS
ncbi:MAG: RnfABCDGE type electron transport complex subunit D, partial [Saprospiraceae bacterium]